MIFLVRRARRARGESMQLFSCAACGTPAPRSCRAGRSKSSPWSCPHESHAAPRRSPPERPEAERRGRACAPPRFATRACSWSASCPARARARRRSSSRRCARSARAPRGGAGRRPGDRQRRRAPGPEPGAGPADHHRHGLPPGGGHGRGGRVRLGARPTGFPVRRERRQPGVPASYDLGEDCGWCCCR